MLTATLIVAVLAVPGTARASKSGHDSPLPSNYISGYQKHGVDCPNWAWPDRPWEYWNTYASGTVYKHWTNVASSSKLCGFAQQTARSLTPNIVTGLFFPILISRAQNGRVAHLTANVPKGWTCYRLPSGWAVSAIDKGGGLSDDAFGVAQGITAPFGYCASVATSKKKHKKKKAKNEAGRFFTWGPAPASTCLSLLKLAGHPDPTDPSRELYPSYDTVLGADDIRFFYTQNPCGQLPPEAAG